MFVLFFILWVIFNGAFTLEIALFGLGISAGIYMFICRFMDFSIRKDMLICKRVLLFVYFDLVLVWEIIKANLVMLKFIVIKQERELHPVIFKLNTSLQSRALRVILSNAITLTPGTITVALKDDELIVHAVDESLMITNDGSFIFEELLLKVERGSFK